MNLSKVRLLKEHDGHYELHDGSASFRVAKAGLSERTHAQIRKMAAGGEVNTDDYLPERRGGAAPVFTFDPNQQEVIPSAAPSFTGADLGLQSAPAASSVALPSAVAPGPSFPPGVKLAPKPEKVLEPTGESSDGKPLMRETTGYVERPLPAGLRLKSDATTPEPAAKPSAQTPGQGGGALPGVTDEQRAVDEERAAIEAKGRIEAETAKQTAAALAEGDKVLQAHELAQKEMATRARLTSEDLMRKHDAAQTALLNQDTTVDPGRFWASRSTAGRISGILGLVLGAFGAGTDGVNRAASMLTSAIDRDIDAQKAEHSLRLQKGKAAVDAAQSMYAMSHQVFANDLAADAAAHATAWARVDNNLKKILAGRAGPQAQAAAAQLSALSLEKQAKFKSDAANIAFDNQTQRILANATAGAKGGAMAGLSKEEQSKVYDVETATRNINDNIARAKDIITRKGTFELTGTEQAELERALGDIAQDSARLKDPGSTVREAELANAKKAIGVAGGEIFTRNDTALKLLDSFGKSIEQRRREALAVRGIRVP